jgi:hypothetical protein
MIDDYRIRKNLEVSDPGNGSRKCAEQQKTPQVIPVPLSAIVAADGLKHEFSVTLNASHHNL